MNFPKLYECDPQKNTECNKRNCGNPCKYTTRKEFSREASEKMTPELAFMVLDVTRRERCEDTPRTRAACNVAQGALYLQMKASPYPDGDENVLACQNCKSGEYLYNEDGNRNSFCGQCGKAMFTLRDDFGGTQLALEAIEQDTRESFAATCAIAAVLAERGELLRRRLGYDPGAIPEKDDFLLMVRPFEIVTLKRAIMTAIELGYGREVTSPADDEIDEGLAELNQKKTR